MKCPGCGSDERRDLGYTMGRHVLLCHGCGRFLEVDCRLIEITERVVLAALEAQ